MIQDKELTPIKFGKQLRKDDRAVIPENFTELTDWDHTELTRAIGCGARTVTHWENQHGVRMRRKCSRCKKGFSPLVGARKAQLRLCQPCRNSPQTLYDYMDKPDPVVLAATKKAMPHQRPYLTNRLVQSGIDYG